MTDSAGDTKDNPIVLTYDSQAASKGSGIKTMIIGEQEKKDSSNCDNNSKQIVVRNDCPFLDTIDRKALDFDFEKLCSISLSKVNVYACLVCGKYFQGRGKSTHAFIHSVGESHHVFLNLETMKFYCLPDNYEIVDDSLSDILYVLKPSFTSDTIERLDKQTETAKAYDGKQYFPGIVGLNNLKHNDYCNVIFQALSHAIPLRNFFLIESNYAPVVSSSLDERHALGYRFGELVRKLWNPRNFKAHVSPHEMLQAIVLSSKKKFEFTKQSDPIIFLGWFLNNLMGPKREKSSIVKRTFQGKIGIATRLLIPDPSAPPSVSITDEPQLIPAPEESYETTSFLYLTLDLPPMPLFPKKDERGKVIKPLVSIHELLSKFDGKTKHESRGYRDASIKRYEMLKLPNYLILYYKRFTRNTFFTEKNTHLVDFQIDNLDLTKLLATGGASVEGKGDQRLIKGHKYTLVANIVHDGEPDSGKGTYRAHIVHRPTGKWFELQDLYVTELADTTLITLSEPYIQVWKLTKH